jgi:hypothetical protein
MKVIIVPMLYIKQHLTKNALLLKCPGDFSLMSQLSNLYFSLAV